MKTKERHHLKQNEFAETAARVTTAFTENRQRVGLIVAGVVGVALIAGGFGYWRKQRTDRAGELLGAAMSTSYAQIAPASSLPGAQQAPGTYPTVAARGDAAIKAFDDVIARYGSTTEGRAAAYYKASEQLALGKFAEAEAGFRDVAASGSSVYGPMAQLGLAETLVAAKKHDEAIKILTDLSANRDTTLPVDGILVQLARANVKAGKTADARAAFKRVTDEFPDSPYAGEARQELAALN